ncbi:MFS transporter [Salinactinospora qingdaonensis]|uniref:DHA2 family efflux MFS transporter permease subunit n=1 Tax=Salinactinospora qingdaonensis TaxID=702744 RepID=A0ABP7GJI1_9ACTN
MAATQPAPSADTAGTPASPRARGAFLLLGALQVTLIFTITLISVPLPQIGRELHLSTSELVLTSTAYGLAFSGLLLFGGRLTDRFEGRGLLLGGLTVFAVAAIAAALAPGLFSLVAARFLQGASAAVIAPAALAVLRALLAGQATQDTAMALWGGLSIAGAMAGTVVSGVVVTWLSWRWMFAVPLLVALLGLALARPLLPRAVPTSRPTLDLPGAALATAGITLSSYGLVMSGETTWTSAPVLLPLLAGVALLGGFVAVERGRSHPLLPLSFLAVPRRALALLVIALASSGAALVTLLVVLYLQGVHGWSPLLTSVAFLPYAATIVTAGWVAPRAVERFGPVAVVGLGLAGAALGTFLLAGLPPTTGFVPLLGTGLVALPLGLSLCFSGAAVLVMEWVPAQHTGLAGGLMNTAMEIGPASGLALLTAVASARTAHLAETGVSQATAITGGHSWAFAAAGSAFALLAVSVAVIARRGPGEHENHTSRGDTP